MRRLLLNMLMSAILLLVVATSANDAMIHKRAAVRMVTASVTIIRTERVGPIRSDAGPQKQDRQIRKRDEKPLVEFY